MSKLPAQLPWRDFVKIVQKLGIPNCQAEGALLALFITLAAIRRWLLSTSHMGRNN